MPFVIGTPQCALDDLRARLRATRWPEPAPERRFPHIVHWVQPPRGGHWVQPPRGGHWVQPPRGGHFGAWEQPALFVAAL